MLDLKGQVGIVVQAATNDIVIIRNLDWLGGYPYEVAKADAVFDFFRDRGLKLQRLKTVGGGSGNNEYVFFKPAEWLG